MEENIINIHLNNLNILKKINLDDIDSLVKLLLDIKGNIYICGVGKNMFIANHFADILKSIGIRCFYFSTINASHGDIGVLQKSDLIIYLSKSGNTSELINMAKLVKNKNIKSILLSSNIENKLLYYTDYNLYIPCDKELTLLIPTTSILSFIFTFNIIVDKIIKTKNMSMDTYGNNHPGGNIGFMINTKIRDVMLTKSLPIITDNINLKNCIFKMTENKQPFILYLENKKLVGIFTDGDLRRILNKTIVKTSLYSLEYKIKDCLNITFEFVYENELLIDVLNKYKNKNYFKSCIPVLNKNDEFEGIINNNILIKYK